MPIAVNYIADIVSKAKSAIADLAYQAILTDYQGDITDEYHHKIGILSDGIRTFENQIDVFLPGTYIITTDQELKILHLMIYEGNLNHYFVRSFTRDIIVFNDGDTFLKLLDTPNTYPAAELIPVINSSKDGLIFQPMSALLPPTFYDLLDKIISGCTFSFDNTNKLKFIVADGFYRINSVDYLFNTGFVILGDGNAVYDRIDAVVLTINGLAVIQGIASYAPAAPTIPNDVLLLSYVLVSAGSTTTGSPGLSDSGDLIGVNTRNFINATPVSHLIVGTAKKYQLFIGSITFSTNHIINLPLIASATSPNINAKEGNSFIIHLNGLVTSGNYILTINENYTNGGAPGTVLKTFTKDELDYVALTRSDGIYVICTFNGTNWVIVTSTEVESLDNIIMFDGDIGLSNFSGTGLGIVGTKHEGWAICNGANTTPDLRNRFIKSNGTEAIGVIGGSNLIVGGIPTINLPVVAPWLIGSHTHSYSGTTGDESNTHTHNLVNINSHSAGGTGIPNIMGSDGGDSYSNVGANLIGHTHSYSGTTSAPSSTAVANNAGGGQDFNNQPAYYVLAFKKRIAIV